LHVQSQQPINDGRTNVQRGDGLLAVRCVINRSNSGRAEARPYVLVMAALAAALLLAGCASVGEPDAAVEAYFEALVAGDETAARTLSCADYESYAASRVTTFANLDARLDGMDCQPDGEVADGTRVACTGQIVITYDADDQQIELGNYIVVQEGGEWRMCGEAE
jgi:hypothetical protein